MLLLVAGGALRADARLQAQETAIPVTVDDHGVMHWSADGTEVALWGVNYTAPFAYVYRALGRLGVDRKQAIDADVPHFARLGLDAYRIHVWDREVSDTLGNLLANEHVDLLDYLLARLAEHGIKVILTPIAWWPPGYPEPDPVTHGLSDGYDKGQMTTEPAARPRQEHYLRQFVAHRNPYTGLTYADDPNLIAIEIFNEPNHPGGAEATTAYVDAMAAAMRDAGFRKPIFYNISEHYSDPHGHAVCSARIDGVSHQWYPTGLVRNGMVGGNMLPNVDRYTIPYADFPECGDKARMVYEFDAADVGGSYMYPAMARSFRGAGFQWATQFAYDPLAIAWSNTEYQTHFLNLVYTPSKAISFMIAGAVFRETPRGAWYGAYPESARFGPFGVSYADDLSTMVTDTAFYYSNSTRDAPTTSEGLRHVAGVGTSPVVGYDGTGAYFLDRLDDGIWRLEVYPDVAWVVDPFTRGSLDRAVARVVWRDRRMRIGLSDLGDGFTIRPLNEGNRNRPAVEAGAFTIRPGVYLLTREPDRGRAPDERVAAFVAPPATDAPDTVIHAPPVEATAGEPFTVRADVVSREPADSVILFARHVGGFGRPLRIPMAASAGFGYAATVPGERLREGLVQYVIAVYAGGEARTFPGGAVGDPYRWDFTGRDAWQVTVVARDAPVLLYDARRDLDHVLYPHPFGYVRFRTDLVSGSGPGRLALAATVDDFTPAPHHFALRTFLPASERTRLAEVPSRGALRIRARAAERAVDRMTVGLVERDGTVWGTVLELTDAWGDYVIPLSELEPLPLALLPRPYPQFLPYLFERGAPRSRPHPADLDGLQFSVSADLFEPPRATGAHGFRIERVVLETGR